jgi:PPOX class probable F420-dependent enzyme
MADPRDHFRNQKFIMLTSFRKSGTGVDTEMWFVLDDGRLFVRTDANHYKVKRMRRNPTVKVAPCDFTGKTTVEPFTARAVEMPASEEPRLARLFAKKFPMGYYLEILVLKPFFGLMSKLGLGKGRGEPVFYEIVPKALLVLVQDLETLGLLLTSDPVYFAAASGLV